MHSIIQNRLDSEQFKYKVYQKHVKLSMIMTELDVKSEGLLKQSNTPSSMQTGSWRTQIGSTWTSLGDKG